MPLFDPSLHNPKPYQQESGLKLGGVSIMTKTAKKIKQILDVFDVVNNIDITVSATHASRNTVKKYLRMYGRIGYSFSNPSRSSSHRIGVPRSDTFRRDTQGEQQSSQWKNESPIAYQPEQTLKQALENKPRELEQKENELNELKQTNVHLVKSIETANESNKNLTERLTKERQDKQSEINTLKGKNEELQHTVNALQKEKETKERNHQRALEEQQLKYNNKDQELQDNKVSYQHTLEKTYDKVSNVFERYDYASKKLHKIFTDKRDRYENEIADLTGIQENAWKNNVLSFIGGVFAGIWGHYIYQKIFSPAPSQQEETFPTNTQHQLIPLLGPKDKNSGIQHLGIIGTNFGKFTPRGYDISPYDRER